MSGETRSLSNLKVHAKGRPQGLLELGLYSAVVVESNLVFVKQGTGGTAPSAAGEASLETLLRASPKNFTVRLEDIVSASVQKGIAWTMDSKIVLNLRDSWVAFEMDGSSVDRRRLLDAQNFLKSLGVKRIDGLVEGLENVRQAPPGVNAIGVLGLIGGTISLIRGSIWLGLGGAAAVSGAVLVASALWLFAMTFGLVAGRRWAWVLLATSSPVWIAGGSYLVLHGNPGVLIGVIWYVVVLFYLLTPNVRRFFIGDRPLNPAAGFIEDRVNLFAIRHPVAGRVLGGLGGWMGFVQADGLARASASLAFFGIDAEFYHKKGADIRLLDDAFFLLHSADAARPSPVKNFEALVDSLRVADFDAYYRALEAADLVRAGRTVEIGGRLGEVPGDLVVDWNVANGTTQLWRLKMLPAPDGDSTAVRLLDMNVLRNQLHETAMPLSGRLPAGVRRVVRMDVRLIPVRSGTAIEELRGTVLDVKNTFGIHELLVRTSAGDVLA